MVKVGYNVCIVHGGRCRSAEGSSCPRETSCRLLLCIQTTSEPEGVLVRVCEDIFADSGDHKSRMKEQSRR